MFRTISTQLNPMRNAIAGSRLKSGAGASNKISQPVGAPRFSPHHRPTMASPSAHHASRLPILAQNLLKHPQRFGFGAGAPDEVSSEHCTSRGQVSIYQAVPEHAGHRFGSDGDPGAGGDHGQDSLDTVGFLDDVRQKSGLDAQLVDQPPKRDRPGPGNYDPIFFLPELNCTAAELTEAEKNRISHRGKAAYVIAKILRKI